MPSGPSARLGDPIGHNDEVTGSIIGPCSPDVFVNSPAKARMDDPVFCEMHPNQDPNVITEGSEDVFTNGQGAARLGDSTSCGAKIMAPVSPDVFIH